MLIFIHHKISNKDFRKILTQPNRHAIVERPANVVASIFFDLINSFPQFTDPKLALRSRVSLTL